MSPLSPFGKVIKKTQLNNNQTVIIAEDNIYRAKKEASLSLCIDSLASPEVGSIIYRLVDFSFLQRTLVSLQHDL